MSAAQEQSFPKLDKYELLEEIGHGGMATVYRARDKRLGREVAVKIIHRHLRENKEVGQRFAAEARAVAKVKHPGIVEVYDVSEEDSEERYLVVELVRGKTLRQLLQEEQSLPAEVAAAIGIEIALGLDHAHGLGVIHRDVKPENVLLRTVLSARTTGDHNEKLVKITDFGIAKLLDAQGVTSTGQVLGSPAHMAPEQIEGGEVSARSDVFGLGVLLYECMVGKLPFDGKNPAQVLRRVLEGAFTSAERVRPTIGHGLGAIVDRALAKEPSQRFATAADLADALRAELSSVGIADPAAEIAAFLQDSAQYRRDFEARIVKELVQRARKARDNGDVPAATIAFNRALAYRPDDAALMAEVSSLARSQRLRRIVVQTTVIIAGSLVVAAVLGTTFRAVGRWRGTIRHKVVPVGTVSTRAGNSLQDDKPAQAESSATPAPPARKTKHRPKPVEPKETPPEPNGSVSILVVGPQNATVLVDGQQLPNWFGGSHDLPAGQHTFEFRPPNTECCEGPVTETVMVEPGKELTVRGTIGWKPALLEFRGSPLSTASCAELGEFSGPGTKTIAVHSASQKAHCTVIPAPQSGEPPKTFDLDLIPGRTSTFPRP